MWPLSGDSASAYHRVLPAARDPPACLQDVLADQVTCRELHRIHPIEACPAQSCPRLFGRGHQPVERDVTERVSVDGAADLVDAHAVRDQLRPGGEVDAVEAGPGDLWSGHTHVHL